MNVTVSSLLAEVPDLAGHEARRLLLLAAQADASWMIGDPVVGTDAVVSFRSFVQRRRQGEPLQYIEGTVQFGPIELLADRRALIPRPETERLWEIALDLLGDTDRPTIVDLCTGSGNLALALKHARLDAAVIGCDISDDALMLARENATRLGLAVSFRNGDLFAALPAELMGSVDLIVSNPPYIAPGDFDQLPEEVKDHEPRQALVADSAGLAVLSRIASQAADWLVPGGGVICEIGEDQGAACLRHFSRLQPQIAQDLADRDRFIVGRSPQQPNVH